MATLKEIAYNIKNLISGGVGSDDSDIDLRQIKFMIHYHRANLLMQYTDNGRKSSDIIYQTDVLSNSSSGSRLKSVLGFNDDRAIREVSLKEDSGIEADYEIIQLVRHADRAFVNQSRFVRKSGRKIATRENDMIYVWDGDSLVTDGTLSVKAAYSNPTDVAGFNEDTSTYPLPEELISVLIKQIAQVEFNLILGTPGKKPNNQADEQAQSKEV